MNMQIILINSIVSDEQSFYNLQRNNTILNLETLIVILTFSIFLLSFWDSNGN